MTDGQASRIVRRLAAALALAASALAGCAAEPSCVFNPQAFAAQTYQGRPGVDFVKWQPETLQAEVVTRSGLMVFIQHWSCMHSGAQGWILLSPTGQSWDVAQALGELADVMMAPQQAGRLRPLIEHHAFAADRADRLDVPDSPFEEYYVATQPVGGGWLLTLRYYRD